jgi:hypothetical protein
MLSLALTGIAPMLDVDAQVLAIPGSPMRIQNGLLSPRSITV